MTLLLAIACLDLSSLLRQLEDDDPAVRDAASAEIHRMGPRVIPDLERAQGTASPELRARVTDLLERFPEYALTSILKSRDLPALRRRWDAVVGALIGKRPIPAGVWEELGTVELREKRELLATRPHVPAEIRAHLLEGAADILRRQAARVGVEGKDPEQLEKYLLEACEARDLLPLVLEAAPDEAAFEEVYGTLSLIQVRGLPSGWDAWAAGDWRLAVRVLVELRRRPGAPALVPPATREEALKLACRGPFIRGIADALGRSFANRGRGTQESLVDIERQQDAEATDPGGLREIYGILFRLDEQIGLHFYRPGLLEPVKAALPLRDAPVPEGHRALFEKVKVGDDAGRVVREILEHLGKGGWDKSEAAAVLLGEIGRRAAEAAR